MPGKNRESTGKYQESPRKVLRMYWESTGKVLGKYQRLTGKRTGKVSGRYKKSTLKFFDGSRKVP